MNAATENFIGERSRFIAGLRSIPFSFVEKRLQRCWRFSCQNKKIMLRTILAGCCFGLFCIGCRKFHSEAPDCIQASIEEFKTSSLCQHGATVKAYRFKQSIVYLFDAGPCYVDGGTGVLDAACHQLGFLGGFIGNSKISGVEFYSNATYVSTLWSN